MGYCPGCGKDIEIKDYEAMRFHDLIDLSRNLQSQLEEAKRALSKIENMDDDYCMKNGSRSPQWEARKALEKLEGKG